MAKQLAQAGSLPSKMHALAMIGQILREERAVLGEAERLTLSAELVHLVHAYKSPAASLLTELE